jgi:hypothetical protein
LGFNNIIGAGCDSSQKLEHLQAFIDPGVSMIHQTIQDRMMSGMNPKVLLEVKVALAATASFLLQLFLRCSDQIANIVSTKVMIKEQTKFLLALLGLGCTLGVNVKRITATDVIHDLPNIAVVKLVSGTSARTTSNHIDFHRFKPC